jgi:phosphate transport system ATP-binding protein
MGKQNEIIKAESKNFDFHYADGTHALKNINLPLYEKKIKW